MSRTSSNLVLPRGSHRHFPMEMKEDYCQWNLKESKKSPNRTFPLSAFSALLLVQALQPISADRIQRAYATNAVRTIPYQREHQAISLKEAIEGTMQNLGIGKVHAAKILKISRQSLYNYTNRETSNSHIQQRKLNRIWEIESISSEVRSILGSTPSAMSFKFKFEGRTLFDLLCADDLDRQKILALAEKLRHKTDLEQSTKVTSGIDEKRERVEETLPTII